ncbi:hypothetical protein ACH4F6_37750 [Streptomyces sp. NPDC017936]|uniref:hypothetical protein n=1 Tax=Streptomyces sp. NPDC017936 TaxID=3365016 RepID=UPI0037BAB118
MHATLTLPDVETTARLAADIRKAWDADEEMPDVAGCAEDAVRVLAIRAAVRETAGEDQAETLAAPPVVEMTGRLLAAAYPELDDVVTWSGHAVVHSVEGSRWEPGGYLHRVYTEAFGPAGGRHWLV